MSIPPARRRVMQVMYDEFASSGNWPIADWVDDELRDEGIDVWRELRSLPSQWGTGGTGTASPHDLTRRYGLTIDAITALGQQRAIALFLTAVKDIVRLEASTPRDPHRPVDVRWTSDHARAALRAPSEVKLLMTYQLVMPEWTLRGSGGGGAADEHGYITSPVSWNFEIKATARQYANVESIDDYLRIRDAGRSVEPAAASKASRSRRLWDWWDGAMDHRGWSTAKKTTANVGTIGTVAAIAAGVVRFVA